MTGALFCWFNYTITGRKSQYNIYFRAKLYKSANKFFQKRVPFILFDAHLRRVKND